MPNEIKVDNANELADEDLNQVVGGTNIHNQKVKMGPKVGLEKKASNMAQKAGREDLRAHKSADDDE